MLRGLEQLEAILRGQGRLRRRNPKTGHVRGYGKIARELDRLGAPTRSGGPWSRSSVRDVLQWR